MQKAKEGLGFYSSEGREAPMIVIDGTECCEESLIELCALPNVNVNKIVGELSLQRKNSVLIEKLSMVIPILSLPLTRLFFNKSCGFVEVTVLKAQSASIRQAKHR